MKNVKLFIKYGPLLFLAFLADTYSKLMVLGSKYHPVARKYLGKQLDRALTWCDT